MNIIRKLTYIYICVFVLIFLSGCLNQYIPNKHHMMDTGKPDKTLNIIEDVSPPSV